MRVGQVTIGAEGSLRLTPLKVRMELSGGFRTTDCGAETFAT
jgi:hypothetical protein